MKNISIKWIFIILIISGCIILTSYFFYMPFRKLCCAEEYQNFVSPNGNYFIKVYRVRVFPMMMPGSAGDAPGFVRLYDRNGVILKEKNVEMVQLIENVEWKKNNVYIKLFAEWALPKY